MRETRRAIAERAERVGFGRVVRVHRQRREARGIVIVLLTVSLGAAAMITYDGGWSHWRLIVVGYAALGWVAAAWVWWGPVATKWRHWYVAAEGGLIVWRPDGPAPRAVPWHALRVEQAGLDQRRLTWQDDSGGRVSHTVPVVSGGRDLFRAVERRSPSSPWSAGRLAGITSFWLASVVGLGVAVAPTMVDVVRGDRPDTLAELGNACDSDTFGGAASYDGPGPHAMAVYLDGQLARVVGAQGDPDPAPHSVSLVACGRLADHVHLESCEYESGYRVELYQGVYRVEVREVRTGRLVDSVSVDGIASTCEEYILVREGESLEREENTRPGDGALAAALSDVVLGDAR
jgi:hypothetical protein